MSGPTINRHKSKQDYQTPPEFISAVEERFGKITFDLAASPENTKANLFFTKEADSLKQQWHQHRGICWLNPPFDFIGPWAKKCDQESCFDETRLGAKILLLVPASVGSNWFARHVFKKCLVIFLNNRITFVSQTTPYPKDCILAAYNFGEPGFEVWRWK